MRNCSRRNSSGPGSVSLRGLDVVERRLLMMKAVTSLHASVEKVCKTGADTAVPTLTVTTICFTLKFCRAIIITELIESSCG